MKHRRSTGIAVAISLLLLSQVIYGELSVVNLKGMTASVASPDTGVKKEFESMSPTVGALIWYSPFLKNIYDYAPDHEPLTSLIRELLYVHTDGTFDVTRSHKKFAYYIDAEFIGQVVGTLAQCHRHKLSPQYFLERWQGTIIPSLAARKERRLTVLMGELGGLQKQAQALAQEQRSLPRTMGRHKDKPPSAAEKERNAALSKNLELFAQQKEILSKEVSKLTDALHGAENLFFGAASSSVGASIAALIEQEQQGKQPYDLTICIFLAILWKYANTIDDLRLYLDTVAATLAIPPDVLYTWPAIMVPYARADYERLKRLQYPAEIGTLSIDDILFLPLGYDLYENPLPPAIAMIGNAMYQGVRFPDCGETSLRNFMNALLYDPITREFDRAIVQGLTGGDTQADNYHIRALRAFYAQYYNAEYIQANKAHNDWARVVSAIPGVAYNKQPGCDIKPGFDTMLRVIQALCPGVQTLEDIARIVEPYGVQVAFFSAYPLDGPHAHYVNNSIQIAIHKQKSGARQPDVLLWDFYENHYKMSFPDRVVDDKFSAFRVVLNLNESPWSLKTACLVALLSPRSEYITTVTSLKQHPRLQDLLLFFLPLENAGQIMATIQALVKTGVTIPSASKVVLTKLIKKIQNPLLFDGIYRVDSMLARDLLQQMATDSTGAFIALCEILKNFPELGDWAYAQHILDRITEPHNILDTMGYILDGSFVRAREGGRLSKDLYRAVYAWAANPATLHNLAKNGVALQLFLGNLSLASCQTGQKEHSELLNYLYRTAGDQVFLSNLVADKEILIKILNVLLQSEIPKDPAKKYYIEALFKWALSEQHSKIIQTFDRTTVTTFLALLTQVGKLDVFREQKTKLIDILLVKTSM